MAASEIASPQDASLPEIAACLGCPCRAGLDLKTFKVSFEHDVDRAADGVTAALSPRISMRSTPDIGRV